MKSTLQRALPLNLAPGLLVAATVAMAAGFLSISYCALVMLFALLLGIAFNFLAEEGRCVEGIQAASTQVLQIGVALLGARITFTQIAELGFIPVATVAGAVVLTMVFGIGVARVMGLPRQFGILTGGSVAICGASAPPSTTLPRWSAPAIASPPRPAMWLPSSSLPASHCWYRSYSSSWSGFGAGAATPVSANCPFQLSSSPFPCSSV